MGEPVKPVMIFTPNLAAAAGAFFIVSTAHFWMASGCPARAGGAKLSRRGSGRSPTHWPMMWQAMAFMTRPFFSRFSLIQAT